MSGVATERSSVEEINEKQAPGDVEVVDVEEDLHIDPAREGALLRKLDLHIAPVMSLIFLLAYLGLSTSSLSPPTSSLDERDLLHRSNHFARISKLTSSPSSSSTLIRS